MFITITFLLFLFKNGKHKIAHLIQQNRNKAGNYMDYNTPNMQVIPSRYHRYQITEDFCKNVLHGKNEVANSITNEYLVGVVGTEIFTHMVNNIDVTKTNFKFVIETICEEVFRDREPTIGHIVTILYFGKQMGIKINQENQSSGYIEKTLSETVSIISVNKGFLRPKSYQMCKIL